MVKNKTRMEKREELRLPTGEKILDIHINEFTCVDEINFLFKNMPDQMCEDGISHRLFNNRKEALDNFKQTYKSNQRTWYYFYTSFEGNYYYQLYEIVID